MSGSLLAIILIPIVALALIGVWITVVLRNASRRPPSHGPGSEPRQRVAGGVFRGDPRQQMPHRDDPAQPGPPADSAAARRQPHG
jgi:hypothetical protein